MWEALSPKSSVVTLQTFVARIKCIPNCDITLVYVKLRLIEKILTLLAANLKQYSTSIFL